MAAATSVQQRTSVEQHRVDLLVMDAHDFPIPARHQLRIDLGDSSAIKPYCFVPFVSLLFESYRLKPV